MDFTKCTNMARDLMDQHIPSAVITGNDYQIAEYPYHYPYEIQSSHWLFGYYAYQKGYKVESVGLCGGLKSTGSNSTIYLNTKDPKAKYSKDDPNWKAYCNKRYYKLNAPTIGLNWKFVATNKEHVVRSTILHEIAHAIHYIRYNINPGNYDSPHGHTKEFRQICKDLGLSKKSYQCNLSYKGVWDEDVYNSDRVESKYRRFLGYKQRSRRGHKYWDRDSVDKWHPLYESNAYAINFWAHKAGNGLYRGYSKENPNLLADARKYFRVDSKKWNSIGFYEYA